MRPEGCCVDEYQAWFEGECESITLESGFSLVGPFIDAVGDTPSWVLDFAIMYSDGMYIRIGETYSRRARREGGRLLHFSYHYAKHNGNFKKDGTPAFTKECVIRIDDASDYKRHIHYQQEDHIPENRLPGLDFDSIDPFKFIRAIEEHRKTGKPLHEILGFTVEPKA